MSLPKQHKTCDLSSQMTSPRMAKPSVAKPVGTCLPNNAVEVGGRCRSAVTEHGQLQIVCTCLALRSRRRDGINLICFSSCMAHEHRHPNIHPFSFASSAARIVRMHCRQTAFSNVSSLHLPPPWRDRPAAVDRPSLGTCTCVAHECLYT